MAEMKSDVLFVYMSDYVPFRGYHIVIAYDGHTKNGGELGTDYKTAIERLSAWAERRGYTNRGGGAWYKNRGGN